MINKFTYNLETFSYNVIIANMYEIYNFFIKHLEKNISSKDLLENYKKILTIFFPIIPHFVSECMEDLNLNVEVDWPKIDKKFLEDNIVNYVIQVNGKKRGLINSEKNITEDELFNIVKSKNLLDKYISNKNIKKTIFVKNKLLNILIND